MNDNLSPVEISQMCANEVSDALTKHMQMTEEPRAALAITTCGVTQAIAVLTGVFAVISGHEGEADGVLVDAIWRDVLRPTVMRALPEQAAPQSCEVH